MGRRPRVSRRTALLVLLAVVVIGVLTGQLELGQLPGGSGDAARPGNGTVRHGGYAVAADSQRLVAGCTTDQILTERRCGATKVVVLDAVPMPYITRNILLAWDAGHPGLLHKGKTGSDEARRAATCGPRLFDARYDDGSCDEYPFASSTEGGAGARTEEVPLREQRCQGGQMRSSYVKADIGTGDAFVVVIANPERAATSGYAGTDHRAGTPCSSR